MTVVLTERVDDALDRLDDATGGREDHRKPRPTGIPSLQVLNGRPQEVIDAGIEEADKAQGIGIKRLLKGRQTVVQLLLDELVRIRRYRAGHRLPALFRFLLAVPARLCREPSNLAPALGAQLDRPSRPAFLAAQPTKCDRMRILSRHRLVDALALLAHHVGDDVNLVCFVRIGA